MKDYIILTAVIVALLYSLLQTLDVFAIRAIEDEIARCHITKICDADRLEYLKHMISDQ